jgi:hypothetical protein
MPCQGFELGTLSPIKSGQGDSVEISPYDMLRYDTDNAELARVGKKPVLKVR